MAKKNKSKSSAPKPAKAKSVRTRRVYERAKSGSKKMGMRWGEVALSAIVGYEGNKILDGTGLGGLAWPYLSNYGPTNDAMSALDSAGYGGSTGGETADVFINKTAGLAAILKSAYDVVKHKRLSDSDKNILIPYAIGTVFDGPASSKTSSNGVWK